MSLHVSATGIQLVSTFLGCFKITLLAAAAVLTAAACMDCD